MSENQNERNDVNARTIEVNAKTVDEAIELGLDRVGDVWERLQPEYDWGAHCREGRDGAGAGRLHDAATG